MGIHCANRIYHFLKINEYSWSHPGRRQIINRWHFSLHSRDPFVNNHQLRWEQITLSESSHKRPGILELADLSYSYLSRHIIYCLRFPQHPRLESFHFSSLACSTSNKHTRQRNIYGKTFNENLAVLQLIISQTDEQKNVLLLLITNPQKVIKLLKFAYCLP